jgi:hypothetical protein
MAPADFPADVRALIDRHLISMDYVEVLLRLRRDGERAWRSEELASELRIEAARAAQALHDLAAAGLARAAGNRYLYAPRSDSDRKAVDGLAVMYNERPVTLVRAIYDRPARALRSFSDAFRIRGQDE